MVLGFNWASTITIVALIVEYFDDPRHGASDDHLGMPQFGLVMCRNFLALYIHLIIDVDIKQSLRLMKYGLNHPWKFRDSATTNLIALFQLI